MDIEKCVLKAVKTSTFKYKYFIVIYTFAHMSNILHFQFENGLEGSIQFVVR